MDFRGSRGNRRMDLLLLTSVLLACFFTLSRASSCPSICTCKWKNGKRWVECQNQGQISIPDSIDPETQVLDLSGNNLQILPREVFARHGLTNLQRLHLARCKIGQIDPSAFRGLTNLVELKLSGNLLTAVPTATFGDIPYLRELRLDSNPLQKVEANAFEMIPQLVHLDLSGCSIKRVAAKAFADLRGLQKLDLSRNKLTVLRHKTVETIKGLHGIELNDNPWTCDCGLRTLKTWLVSQNVPYTTAGAEPRCASPRRISGRAFSALSSDEFACPPEIVSAPRYVEAEAGQNATLRCQVGSVPTARVRWFYQDLQQRREILNNSASHRGEQRFIMYDRRVYNNNVVVPGPGRTSTLVLTKVRAEDSGKFICVAENRAGMAEANFTLQVGYFVGGVASLESSEIAGIAVSFSFVAILVLMFVVIFVARHRFNRGGGIGVGGNCARRWRHEKPNGGASVEKVNGSVHNGLELKGNGTPSSQPPPPPQNAATTTYATANFDIGGNMNCRHNCVSNGNGSIVGVGGAIQSSTQNILEDTDDDDDGFRNNAGENARNAAIASAASNSAFEETATTPRMGVRTAALKQQSEHRRSGPPSPHIYANQLYYPEGPGVLKSHQQHQQPSSGVMTRSFEDSGRRHSGFYSPQLPHRQISQPSTPSQMPQFAGESWRGSGPVFFRDTVISGGSGYPADYGLPKATSTLPNRPSAHAAGPFGPAGQGRFSPLTGLAEEPETDIVSPTLQHHSSPSPKTPISFQHPYNRRLVSSPTNASATMSRIQQSSSAHAQRRLFSPMTMQTSTPVMMMMTPGSEYLIKQQHQPPVVPSFSSPPSSASVTSPLSGAGSSNGDSRTLKTGNGCGGTGNGVVGGSRNGSRESPDEGIQDDCSTDV